MLKRVSTLYSIMKKITALMNDNNEHNTTFMTKTIDLTLDLELDFFSMQGYHGNYMSKMNYKDVQ